MGRGGGGTERVEKGKTRLLLITLIQKFEQGCKFGNCHNTILKNFYQICNLFGKTEHCLLLKNNVFVNNINKKITTGLQTLIIVVGIVF